jgi:hypothetical protein
VAEEWFEESGRRARGMRHMASRQTGEGSVMSSTVKPAIGSGTAGATGAVKHEEGVGTSAGGRTVLAMTRIVVGFTFVLGLRRQLV